MKLGIDALRLLGPRTGVGRVTESLLRHLDGIGHPFEEVRLYSPRKLPADLELPQAAHSQVVASWLPLGLWQQWSLPRTHGGNDVLLCPSYVVPVAARCPTLLIHHGSYEGYPQAFSLARRLRARLVHTISARRATRIVTVSEHSRQDILRFYGVPESKVRVIANGVDTDLFRPISDERRLEGFRREVFGEDFPFLLYVGKDTPRRNLREVVEAFDRCRTRLGWNHQLLFLGFRLEESSLATLVRRLGLEEVVHSLGHVSQERLAVAYNAADLLVYPSSYEGFGLPVLEAMACGTPALALDRTAFPEFAQGVALLLPDASVETLATGIETILGDKARRQRMAEDGPRRAAQYGWPKVTKHYVQELVDLAGAAAGGS